MATVEDVQRHLADALHNREAGDTRVIEVRVRADEDSEGTPAFFLDLVLTNPRRNLETWPVEDILALRDIVRDAVAQVALDERPWFIAFEPEENDELAPEDEEAQVRV